MSRKEAFFSVFTIVAIFAAAVITLVEFGIAQGQGNLTAEQKAAICDPNNPKLKFVNGTESRICGIAKTIKSSANASSSNATTGTEAQPPSSTSIAPSVIPTP